MKRLEWVDNAKGIGILLVIIAHVINQVQTLLPASTIIYTFHMPLFFILSGFTLSDKTMSMNPKQLILKYAKTLGIPYFVYTFTNMLFQSAAYGDFSFQNLSQNTYRLFFLHGWKATWFLPALFFSLIFSIILIQRISNKYVLFSVTCAASLVMARIGSHIPGVFKAPVLAIIAMPFVIFGCMMHMKELRSLIESRFCPYVSAMVILLAACFNGKIDFVWFQFGRSSFIWLLSGIIGSQIVFSVARSIHYPFLAKVGRRSLIIMCIHQIIMFTMHRIICFFTSNQYLQLSALLFSTVCLTLLVCPVVDRIYSLLFSKTQGQQA